MDRNIEITAKYVTGECLTYEELAQEYGITRERIRQILNKTLELYQLEEIKKQNSKLRQKIILDKKLGGTCKLCGKIKFKESVYCGMDCMIKERRTSPEVRREKMRGYVKKYYEKNKDEIQVNNKKWREKPEVKARLAKIAKKRYLKMKGNPVAWANYLQNANISNYKRLIRECTDNTKVEEYRGKLNNLIAEKHKKEK